MGKEKKPQNIMNKIKIYLKENPEMLIAIMAILVYIAIDLTLIRGIEWDSGMSQNFFGTILGAILDVFLFGILIDLINKKMERKRNIERWKEEIDDFRGWDEKEAMYRIVGNIKRLNRMKVSNVNLDQCFLTGVDLNQANLKGATFQRANLRDANLSQANLQGINFILANLRNAKFWEVNLRETQFTSANLWGANFWKANLQEVNFYLADLQYAKFHDANLHNTSFRQANIYEADFQGADFQGADLSEAINLSIEQLSKAKTLYKAKLDPELEQQMREKYPHLLEESKDEAPGPRQGDFESSKKQC